MTPRGRTVREALYLYYNPASAHVRRNEPLPEDTTFLLCLAAAQPVELAEASALTGRDEETIRSAATFFVEQILLYTKDDSYRVLGGTAQDPTSKLRRHMTLLMRSIHPDVQKDLYRTLLARRVIRAWDDLKSPQRRAAYDAACQSRQPPPQMHPVASRVKPNPVMQRPVRKFFDRRGRWGISSFIPRRLLGTLSRLLYSGH